MSVWVTNCIRMAEEEEEEEEEEDQQLKRGKILRAVFVVWRKVENVMKVS